MGDNGVKAMIINDKRLLLDMQVEDVSDIFGNVNIYDACSNHEAIFLFNALSSKCLSIDQLRQLRKILQKKNFPNHCELIHFINY